MTLVSAVEEWVSASVDQSVTTVTAGWDDRADYGAPWVSVGLPEVDFPPAQIGGGDARWALSWTVPVYVGPGGGYRAPAAAWAAGWEVIRSLLDALASGIRPQIAGTWWADPAAVVVDDDYTEEAGTLVLRLDLAVNTVGWEGI